jgi:hypothetical protein
MVELFRMKATPLRRWTTVVAFAMAMAWVESAVVYYLRTMIDRIQPHQPDPIPIVGDIGSVELVREAATLLMLLTVGMLAGRTWRSRLGYTAVAFGAWDIFYYLFLKVMCGWPGSLFEWDLLFLIPLPWWGPVLAPVSIAMLMVAWGTLAGEFERPAGLNRSEFTAWAVATIGIIIALYVFMADAIGALDQGAEAVRNVLPRRFNWPARVSVRARVHVCARSGVCSLSARAETGAGEDRSATMGRVLTETGADLTGAAFYIGIQGRAAECAMQTNLQLKPWSAGVLLRGELAELRAWTAQWEWPCIARHALTILVGAGLYGAAMGWWRAPLQAGYVGLKLPLIILLTAIGNGLLNAMLAPLLGLNIPFRQSFLSILTSFAIASLILAGFSPLVAFLVWNVPPISPQFHISAGTYSFIMVTHVCVIAFSGTMAHVHLRRLLMDLGGSRAVANRVVFAWLAGNLFLGSQLSWILRPFIGAPGLPVQFFREHPLEGNFYEALFRALTRLLNID